MEQADWDMPVMVRSSLLRVGRPNWPTFMVALAVMPPPHTRLRRGARCTVRLSSQNPIFDRALIRTHPARNQLRTRVSILLVAGIFGRRCVSLAGSRYRAAIIP